VHHHGPYGYFVRLQCSLRLAKRKSHKMFVLIQTYSKSQWITTTLEETTSAAVLAVSLQRCTSGFSLTPCRRVGAGQAKA
jgi:hypothetical protein